MSGEVVEGMNRLKTKVKKLVSACTGTKLCTTRYYVVAIALLMVVPSMLIGVDNNQLDTACRMNTLPNDILAIPETPTQQVDDSIKIKLKSAKFDPLVEAPEIPGELQLTESDGYYIVQFTGPILGSWKETVRRYGGTFHGYIPDYAFVVSMDEHARTAVSQLPYVRWVGLWHPAYKISPELKTADGRIADYDGTLPIVVRVYENAKLSPEFLIDLLELEEKDKLLKSEIGLKSPDGREPLLLRREDVIKRAIIDPEFCGGVKLDSRLAEFLRHPAMLEALQKLNALEATIVDLGWRLIIAEVESWMIAELAFTPCIEWIQRYYEPQLYVDEARTYTGAADVETNFGYTGNYGTAPISGVPVAVYDSGCDYAHTEFGTNSGAYGVGTNDQIIAYLYDDTPDDNEGHGTCTAGIVGAKGNTVAAKGMAPALTAENPTPLIIQEMESLSGDAGATNPSSVYTAISDAAAEGALVHSNSWGPGGTNDGTYDYTSQDVDAAVRDFGVVVCFAAGNEGPGTLGNGGASAKNSIAVGMIDDFDNTDPSDDILASSSSTGPAADGRIKPDIVTDGNGIYTTDISGTDGYSTGAYTSAFGGTSGATPIIAGLAALFIGAYRDNYWDNYLGTGPSPALTKAMLISGAEDLTASTAPDYGSKEGWGSARIGTIIETTKYYFMEDQGVELSTGETYTKSVYAMGPGTPLKISLVWTDPYASAYADPTLVNDLNLRVIAPDGTEYRGNQYTEDEGVANDATWTANPTTWDTLNNVENVFFDDPIAGEWTIEVIAENVATDAIPSTAEVGQDFALAIRGVASGVGVLRFDDANYRAGEQAYVNLSDTELNVDSTVQETQDVRIFSGKDPWGIWLTLTETGPDTGLFSGLLSFSEEGSSPGTIWVNPEDTVTASYHDLSPIDQYTNVTCAYDSVPPEIKDMRITWVGKQEFDVFWYTDEPATTEISVGTSPPPAVPDMTFKLSDLTTAHLMFVRFGWAIVYTAKGYYYWWQDDIRLVPDTVHYFYLGATDAAGNYAMDNNYGQYYRVKTHQVQPYSMLYVEDGGWAYMMLTLYELDLAFDFCDREGRMTRETPYHDTTPDLKNANSPIWGSISKYDVVIWECGIDDSGTFNSSVSPDGGDDQTLIDNYLSAGGYLFVTGCDIGFDATTDTTGTAPAGEEWHPYEQPDDETFEAWYESTFHCDFQADDASSQTNIQHPDLDGDGIHGDEDDWGSIMNYMNGMGGPIPGGTSTATSDEDPPLNSWDLFSIDMILMISYYADAVDPTGWSSDGYAEVYHWEQDIDNPGPLDNYFHSAMVKDDAGGHKTAYTTIEWIFVASFYLYGYPTEQMLLLLNTTNWLAGTSYTIDWENWTTEPTTSISGYVDDYYQPVYSAIVYAYAPGDYSTVLGAAVTDSDGYYRMTGLWAGQQYDVFAQRWYYESAYYKYNPVGDGSPATEPSGGLPADTDTPNINISLGGHSIEGYVYDLSTGDPIIGASIVAIAQETGGLYKIVESLSPDGDYHLTGLPDKTYKVRCSAAGYWSQTKLNIGFTESYNVTLDFYLEPAGAANILFVDDDGVGSYADHDYNEVLIQGALDDNGYMYNIWEVGSVTGNGPSAADMDPYDIVIWSCGWAYEDGATLTNTDQTELGNYLSNTGGTNPVQNLLLIGADVVYGIDHKPDPTSFSAGDFLYDYMYVDTVDHDEKIPNPLEGVTGNPISDGSSYSTYTDNYDWSDHITEIRTGGSGTWWADPGGYTKWNAVNADPTGYKSVFIAFDFYYFNDWSADIADAIRRCVDWFAVTPPVPPSNLQLTISGNDVVLTWTDSPTSNVDDYYIYRTTIWDATLNEPAFDFTTTYATTGNGDITTYTDVGVATDANTYYYCVRAHNPAGTDHNRWYATKYPPVSMVEGWNLISVPLIQKSTYIADVLEPLAGNYEIVWYYNASTPEQHWSSFNPDYPSPFISPLQTVNHKMALWVKMTTTDSLPTAGVLPTTTAIELLQGWNFIGYPSLKSVPVATAMESIAGKYSIIWRYDASDALDPWKMYDPYDPGASDLTEMVPGAGYWIKATEDCTLIINA